MPELNIGVSRVTVDPNSDGRVYLQVRGKARGRVNQQVAGVRLTPDEAVRVARFLLDTVDDFKASKGPTP